MASRSLITKFWMSDAKLVFRQQKRQLTLYEYQSHSILREFGIPTPRGKLAESPAEAEAISKELNGNCVIKSQILGGGRTKGTFDNGFKGGVKVVGDARTAGEVAKKMLGHRLQTKKTQGEGLLVGKVYIAEKINHDDEWYISMTFDREQYCPAIVVSKSGGVDIETIAKQHPEQLRSFSFSLTEGITPDIVHKISNFLGASKKETESLQNILGRLYGIFTTKDAILLEINPLARSSDGTLTCLNSKFTFDDAAGKRQKDLFANRNPEHEIPEELEAEKYGLVYVRMDGNIGNVVNGAGLAMATNDAIALHGGASANFLDAGGQATKETMVKAFEIILRDDRVKTILVNIYGGITRGDMIAESIIGAAKELGPLKVPMVVRLQGTNSELGLKILEEANLGLHTEADFGEAARKAVELARSSSSSVHDV